MRNSSLLREYGRRLAGVAAFAVIWVLSQATVRSDPPAGSGASPSLHPELALQIGHVGMVWCVAFSPDGKTLASGSWDKTLKLWDVETGSVRRALTKHEGGVNTVAFSRDGTLASGGYDGVVRLWDAATGELKRTLTGHAKTVRSVAFSPDGTMLVSGSEDRTVRLWDVGAGRLTRTLTGHEGEVSSVAFAPDGRTVASGSVDKTVKLWDVNTGSLHRTLTGHGGEVNSVAFAPDGRGIASGSNDRTVRLWDLATGSVRRTLMGHGGEVSSVAYAPDGRMLASGSLDTTVKLWDVNMGSVLRTLPGNKDAVLSLAFAPHGRTLASGLGMGEMFSQRGSAVMLWDVATGRVTRTLRGHQGWVRSAAIAPDGKSFASASSDTTVKLWDAATGELRATLAGHEGGVNAVAFSPDGETLASGSADGTVKLWDVETRSVRRTLKGHDGGVNSVAFTPDGRTVVSGSTDGTVRLWDAGTGELYRTLTGHGAAVWAVACSPYGKTLASGSENQTVKLWDAQTGSVLRTLPEHSAGVWTLAFSSDGKTLATGDYSVVKLWNTETGQLQRELTGHHYWLFSLAFAPDGKTLASGNYDKTIKLWDLETGRLKQTLTGHESGIWAVPFSPDGKTLVSGSFDTTIRLWDLSANAAQAPMSARHRATLIALPPREGESISNDALILTPEGYYDSTPGAARFIKWRVANDLFPVEAYERVFYRPHLVRKALRGEAVPRAERDVERFLAGQLIPPQVTFAIPHDGQEVAGDTIAVELTATDDRAVTEMELLVNGRPFAAKPIRREAKPIPLESKAIPTAAGPVAPEAKPIPIESKPIPSESRPLLASHRVQQRFLALVPLPPGERHVTLKALVADEEDLQGWTEIRLARRLASPVMGDLHVLSVGVSQYRDARFNLKYAARDAEAFANLWKPMEGRLYRRVIVTRVTDAQATAANVRAALVRVIHLATARDGVALFLSGHGIVYPTQRGEFHYFATHEVDPARVNDTALPWTVFQEALRKTRAKRVLLFLDACHSGSSLGTRQANNEQLLGELLRRNTGVMVFASSRRSEFSYEVEAKQHGAFTAALVEAIAEGRADLDIGTGRDGVITSEEIQTYLRTRVPQLTGNLQTPICPLMGDFGEPFPLARLR